MTREEKRAIELAKLKKYCEENGVPTHAQTLKLKGIIRPASWFVYNFGSWDSALRLIGFRQTTKKRVKIPKEKALEDLKKYFQENGVESSQTYTKHCKELGLPSANYFIVNFGSWKETLNLIGLKYQREKKVKNPVEKKVKNPKEKKIKKIVKKNKSYIKEEKLQELKEYFQNNGVKPLKFMIENHKELGLPSAYYFIKQFGSWRTTVELTGFEYNPRLDRKEKQKYRTKIKFGYKFTPEEYDVIEKSIELAKSEYKTFTKAFYEICKFYLKNKEKDE